MSKMVAWPVGLIRSLSGEMVSRGTMALMLMWLRRSPEVIYYNCRVCGENREAPVVDPAQLLELEPPAECSTFNYKCRTQRVFSPGPQKIYIVPGSLLWYRDPETLQVLPAISEFRLDESHAHIHDTTLDTCHSETAYFITLLDPRRGEHANLHRGGFVLGKNLKSCHAQPWEPHTAEQLFPDLGKALEMSLVLRLMSYSYTVTVRLPPYICNSPGFTVAPPSPGEIMQFVQNPRRGSQEGSIPQALRRRLSSIGRQIEGELGRPGPPKNRAAAPHAAAPHATAPHAKNPQATRAGGEPLPHVSSTIRVPEVDTAQKPPSQRVRKRSLHRDLVTREGITKFRARTSEPVKALYFYCYLCNTRRQADFDDPGYFETQQLLGCGDGIEPADCNDPPKTPPREPMPDSSYVPGTLVWYTGFGEQRYIAIVEDSPDGKPHKLSENETNDSCQYYITIIDDSQISGGYVAADRLKHLSYKWPNDKRLPIDNRVEKFRSQYMPLSLAERLKRFSIVVTSGAVRGQEEPGGQGPSKKQRGPE